VPGIYLLKRVPAPRPASCVLGPSSSVLVIVTVIHLALVVGVAGAAVLLPLSHLLGKWVDQGSGCVFRMWLRDSSCTQHSQLLFFGQEREILH